MLPAPHDGRVMTIASPRLARQLARRLKRMGDAAVTRITVCVLKAIRMTDPDRAADFAGRVMRTLGPWLPEHRTGRANLAMAFPSMGEAEVERILHDVWDNLGRVAAEFAHLDRLWDFDPAVPRPGRIEIPPESMSRFLAMRDDGKPALLFAAHLANWELPALPGPAHGAKSAVLYRGPNIAGIAAAVVEMRAKCMGTLIPTGGFDTGPRIADELERGAHVGMLVDQHYTRGVEVTFFGHRCKANPLIARLARHFDCPIYGTRVIRLPKHRFKVELTEPMEPMRDAAGAVDVAATMQMITSVIETWVREHPDQWLWLHRRWR
jgi:Kdo2-lipid IVA lauroyltransferase/acyltransferase